MNPCERHGIIGCEDCNPTIPQPGLRITDRPEAILGAGQRWSEVEHSVAEDLTYTDAEVGELLDRTANAVHMYRLNHGIIEKSRERNLDYGAARMMQRWTPEEVAFLAEHRDLSMDTLVAYLGRSAVAIRTQLRKL